jgi:hypothetical protein
MERIVGMAERARYDGRRGSSTRSTKAPRWYMPAASRVVDKSHKSTRCFSRCRDWSVCNRRYPCSCPNTMLDDTRPTYDAVFCCCLQSRTPLLTLPSKAKINMKTLGHYPHSKRLTATQLISLHLLLHKPSLGCESDDPHFGPYISILPRDFGGHPLTWVVHRTLGAGSREEHTLLRLLPPSVLFDLLLLEGRFWKDWEAVRHYLVGHKHSFQTFNCYFK